MTVPRWPDIYAALLALLPTLPALAGVEVYDGQPVTNDVPLDYITVGYADEDTAGGFRQELDESGFGTVETGEVKCHFVAQAGDTDPTLTRNRAFQMVGALQEALTADRTFGGLLEPTALVNLSADVLGVQNGAGSAQSLVVTVTYWVQTYFTSS